MLAVFAKGIIMEIDRLKEYTQTYWKVQNIISERFKGAQYTNEDLNLIIDNLSKEMDKLIQSEVSSILNIAEKIINDKSN